MARYRKKPVVIEAVQFRGKLDSVAEINALGKPVLYVPRGYEHDLRYGGEMDRNNGHILDDAPAYLVIDTLEGRMRADIGDWIICGVQGEIYPCKPDIFEATYEPV